MKIKKAIIPAAGLGTRMLPATKSMPKEMLPVFDKPTLQYIIEEAISSGIEEITHPLYMKQVRKTTKFKAHDENNEAHIGDTVKIMETRPLSKDKRWRLVNIVEAAK